MQAVQAHPGPCPGWLFLWCRDKCEHKLERSFALSPGALLADASLRKGSPPAPSLQTQSLRLAHKELSQQPSEDRRATTRVPSPREGGLDLGRCLSGDVGTDWGPWGSSTTGL